MVLVGLRTTCFPLLVVLAAGVLVSVASAEEVHERLPFVADDAAYPRGRPAPLLWPTRERSGYVPGTDLTADGADDSHVRDPLPVQLPAFPDPTQLLGSIPDIRMDDAGGVAYAVDHPERERIQRLLAAARRGYARDIRVQIVVDRPEGSASGQRASWSAEQLLADGGELRVDTRTRAGALVFDDARRDVTYPAQAYVSTSLVTPEPVVFRVGPRVGLTVTPLTDDVLVLDLDLHLSRAAGPVTLDEPAVRRVVPIVDVLALRAAIPLANGHATSIEVPGARIAVRVTRGRSATADGVLVLALPAYGRTLPPALPLPTTHVPLLSEGAANDVGTHLWDDTDARVRVVPDPWFDAARAAGVRAAPLPPGLVVVEGTPDAIARFRELTAATRTVEAWRVTAPLLRLPVVAGTSWTCAAGRLDPVRRSVRSDASYDRAVAVSRVSFRALGTFVHGRADGSRLHVAIDTVVPRDLGAVGRSLPLGATKGAGAAATAVDASSVRATRREASLAPGDEPQDGIALERIEVGR